MHSNNDKQLWEALGKTTCRLAQDDFAAKLQDKIRAEEQAGSNWWSDMWQHSRPRKIALSAAVALLAGVFGYQIMQHETARPVTAPSMLVAGSDDVFGGEDEFVTEQLLAQESTLEHEELDADAIMRLADANPEQLDSDEMLVLLGY